MSNHSKVMTHPLPPPLQERLAEGRFDFHYIDAQMQGIPPLQLSQWVKNGYLTPLRRGDYIITAPDRSTESFSRAREKYLRLCASVVLGHSGFYLVGKSALCAYGLPLLELPRAVEVSHLTRTRSCRPCVSTFPPWGDFKNHFPGGVPSQPRAAAVIQCAATHGIREGLVAADGALHTGLAPQELEVSLKKYGRRRGIGAARFVTQLADGRIESPGESLLRLELHRVGLEAEPQVVLTTPTGTFVARVDFLIAGSRVVIEFDGLMKYTEPSVLRDEKVRQLAIERLGYTVLRFSFRDLHQPGFIVATTRRALAHDKAP